MASLSDVRLKPLSDCRIVWTCPGRQNAGAAALQTWGAQVDHIPLIQTEPVTFTLDVMPPDFDWLFFTSGNGVQAFYERALKQDPTWQGLPVATVGPATTAMVTTYGIQPDWVSPQFDAENAARAFSQSVPCEERRIFWPCGNLANRQLSEILSAAGAQVISKVVYETTPAVLSEAEIQVLAKPMDCLVFSSPSGVQAWVKLAETYQLDASKTELACLGPKTAQAAKDLLGRCTIQPPEATFEALTRAIYDFYLKGERR